LQKLNDLLLRFSSGPSWLMTSLVCWWRISLYSRGADNNSSFSELWLQQDGLLFSVWFVKVHNSKPASAIVKKTCYNFFLK